MLPSMFHIQLCPHMTRAFYFDSNDDNPQDLPYLPSSQLHRQINTIFPILQDAWELQYELFMLLTCAE